MTTARSILDLAIVGPGENVADGLAATVDVARRAEALGYRRIWYAEHHNMATIASSATAVLIARVAAHTDHIRLGSGGIMLPNHSPLTIAEQFGTLATLHPGRIDLGLGRAPGTDPVTTRALRRDPSAADRFPQDVVELQGYLDDETRVATVHAIPGRGTHVPLYILGSSRFGAELAGLLGLPFAFASHFAPALLEEALTLYRTRFRSSTQLEAPYVIVGVNVIAADTDGEVEALLLATRRSRVKHLFRRGAQPISDEDADRILESPEARHVDQMLSCRAVGTRVDVLRDLDRLAENTGADELMTVHQGWSSSARLRSIELAAP